MEKTLRLFIAVELDTKTQKSLAQLISSLQIQAQSNVRWVKPENIHLTLKFLGEVPLARIPALKKVIEQSTAKTEPLTLLVRGTGCFPNAMQSRVLWVGVEAPPPLFTLQKTLDSVLVPLGFTSENRPFSPHLTLGRVADQSDPTIIQNVVKKLLLNCQTDIGRVSVKSITLFRSTLAHGGSIYTPEAIVPFSYSSEIC